MGRIYYRIADSTFELDVPADVTISEESKAFLISEKEEQTEKIVFLQVDDIPLVAEQGVWHKERYYIMQEARNLCFVSPGPKKQFFAINEYGEEIIKVFYIKNSKDMVFETSFMLNLLGLERLLLRKNTLILHASFITYNKEGILFSAPSGTGKSTQAELWKKYKGADIINGDRAGIRFKDGEWRAYGLPFAGSSRIYRNESAKLSAIVILQKGKENTIGRMSKREAFQALYPEISVHRWNEEFVNKVLDICFKLLDDVSVYRLVCRPDYGAVELLSKTITDEGEYSNYEEKSTIDNDCNDNGCRDDGANIC